MTSVTNINEVLSGRVGLEVHCVDRLLLNAYVPNLQVSGQVVTFLTQHLRFPIPWPALLEKIGNRFRRENRSPKPGVASLDGRGAASYCGLTFASASEVGIRAATPTVSGDPHINEGR